MVGLDKNDSDIDIIIYGTENSYNFQQKLPILFERISELRKYNLKEYKNHFNWRVGGSDITFENFMKSERRKLHQGKFHDYDFFIRYIKSPHDWKGNYYDYRYTNLGRIKIRALINESQDSIFTPCSYKIEPLEILNKNQILADFNFKNILEVNSYRGRFCEHAKDGEIVLVEGKLEKVQFKNNLEFYRIILTDQTIDKMIIMK
jgi:predicted nucleotidyltransferase